MQLFYALNYFICIVFLEDHLALFVAVFIKKAANRLL